MVLHTVNKSPYANDCLKSCLRTACPNNHCILLIEDGVYAAVNSEENNRLWSSWLANGNVYALQDDITARGLTQMLLPHIQVIDYAEFVKLTVDNSSIQSWY